MDTGINLTFTFLAGSQVLTQVNCSSSVEISIDQSAALSCSGDSALLAGYDSIEVHDNALYE